MRITICLPASFLTKLQVSIAHTRTHQQSLLPAGKKVSGARVPCLRGRPNPAPCPWSHSLSLIFLNFKIFIFLAALGLSCGMRTLGCNMQDLVPYQGRTRTSVLEVQS